MELFWNLPDAREKTGRRLDLAKGAKTMAQFWVVGGEFTDTHFHEALDGSEEWIGPFSDYHTAKREWAKRAWKTVDNGHTRYRIEKLDPDSLPCTD